MIEDDITREVSFWTFVPISQILSDSRKEEIVKCRCMIATLLRAEGWGLAKIGDYLNRNHATVINLLKKHKKVRVEDNFYRKQWHTIRNKFKDHEVDKQIEWHTQELSKLRERKQSLV